VERALLIVEKKSALSQVEPDLGREHKSTSVGRALKPCWTVARAGTSGSKCQIASNGTVAIHFFQRDLLRVSSHSRPLTTKSEINGGRKKIKRAYIIALERAKAIFISAR